MIFWLKDRKISAKMSEDVKVSMKSDQKNSRGEQYANPCYSLKLRTSLDYISKEKILWAK